MRPDKRTRVRWRAGRILVLAGILGLLGVQCKSPTSPKGSGEADITIRNDYGEALDIYLDGTFEFALRYRSSIEIDDVALYHEYSLEAKDPATGRLIDSTVVDVQAKTEYAWTINPAPRIKVINDWTEKQGEKLAIDMDGVFQFNLERGESRMIMKVDFGERFLKAVNAGTRQEVASITFKVDTNQTYEWVIKK